MLTRIGVIGPWEWMERVERVASRLPDLAALCLGYLENREVPDIVLRSRTEVDGFLFCGLTPEKLGSPVLPAGFPRALVKFDLHAVMRTLYEIRRDNPYALEHGVSIDTVDADDVEELKAELGIRPEAIYYTDIRGNESLDEVVRFHTLQHECGNAVALATGMKAAHRVLVEQGLPAYYIRATNGALTDGLLRAIDAVRYSRSQDAQVALVVIEVVSFVQRDGALLGGQKAADLVVGLHGLLQEAAARAQCWLTATGEGAYLIFATRGTLPLLAGESFDVQFVSEARDQLGINLNVGIGLGQTTVEAHGHAWMGLLSARRTGSEGAIYVVHADGHAIGPIHAALPPASRSAQDPRLAEIAATARVSVPTVATLVHWAQVNNRSYVTTAELSVALGVTQRSARRVLSALCDRGLARIASEERSRPLGRPRYLYRLDLGQLSTPL